MQDESVLKTSRWHRAALAVTAVWPNLRYFSLGILLAWLFLVVDFGAWMTTSDVANLSVINVGMHVYGASAVVLVASAWGQRAFERFFALRFAPVATAGIPLFGVILLIASGPRFFAAWELSSTLFQIGSMVVGVGVALMILMVGRIYCSLEASKVFLFAALSELLVAVIFYIVVGNSWLAIVPDGPPASNILAVVLLPIATVVLATLPGPTGGADASAPAESLSLPAFFKTMPMMAKLMVAVFVFSAASSVVRNFFMLDQAPDVHQLNSQQAMLLRFSFALLLLLAAVFLVKKVSLGKLYLSCMAALALVMAALPLLDLDSTFPLVFTSALSSVNSFIVWCLLSFVSKSGRFSPFLTFGLGEGFSQAGLAVGYACGYGNVFKLFGAGDSLGTPIAVLFIGLIIACIVLVFTEKDFDSILEEAGASRLNVRAAIMRSRKRDKGKSEERPWQQACRIVGKRAQLSDREMELLNELARNRTPQEIASQLSITVSTVRTHTHKIYVKLDVHSRDELIALVRNEFEALER